MEVPPILLRRFWWVGLVIVALVGLVVWRVAPRPEKFDYGVYIYIWGEFGDDWGVSGQFNACEGAGRFSDLRLGAPVVVEDAQGKTLATHGIAQVGINDSSGRMGRGGSLSPLDPDAAGCNFYTGGEAVPELDSYQLRVGSLPPMVVTRGDGLEFDWRLEDDEVWHPSASESGGRQGNPLAKMFVREDRAEFKD